MDSEINSTTSRSVDASTVFELTDSTTNTNDEKDYCSLMDKILDGLLPKLMFFYSILVIFALGFIVRRKALCLRCCWRRPGAVQPIDFIDEIRRRWAYAACFVIIISDVLLLFVGESFWDIKITGDPEWAKKFDWIKVFTKLLDVLSVCLVYFPLLACIDLRRSVPANILGLTNLIPWIFCYCLLFIACPISSEEIGVQLFIFRVPIFVSYFVVGFSYVLDFVINVRRWRKRRTTVNVQEKTADTVSTATRNYKIYHHWEYVVNLLRKKTAEDIEQGKGVKVKLQKVVNRTKYEKVLGFRYSTRLICCLTISTTVLVWFLVLAIYFIDPLMRRCSLLCEKANKFLGEVEFIETICQSLIVVKIVAHFSSAFSALVVFILLVNTLITYKRRWHQLLRGDHSWHIFGDKLESPQGVLLNGLKYAGYQVAFVIWGWVILTLFVFVVLMFVSFALVIPLRDKVRNWLIRKLIDQWPTLLFGIVIIPFTQRMICRFLFLQEKGSVMALTNRRVYNAVSYYFLILNIIVGIFSCLKRIVIPLVLGIVFLSRLDQPLIMKGYESTDPGYVAFVSMLLVDLYHNHPVVKTFVELMIEVRNKREVNEKDGLVESVELREKNLRSRRIRNRWLKTLTLINNPSLTLKALELRLIDERSQTMKQLPPESNDNEGDIDSTKKEMREMESMQNAKPETDSIEMTKITSSQDNNRPSARL